MRPRVAVITTLDTKGYEVLSIVNELKNDNITPVIVDSGVYPPESIQPDLRLVKDVSGLRRDAVMDMMGRSAANYFQKWVEDGQIDGIIGLGGNQGTAICGLAMRELPHGFPRIVITTVATNDVREHFEDSDVYLVSPVSDLVGGPNQVNEPILKNSARAISAMARAYQKEQRYSKQDYVDDRRPSIALTAFGNTENAVINAMKLLDEAGYDTVGFHASGAGGPSLDRLVNEGWFEGVIEFTPHELLAELYPEDIYRPIRKGRLMAAVEQGIPLVVAPGALNYFCFGSFEELLPKYQKRQIHYHNPYNTNVRANAVECEEVGRELARRLNLANGPVAVLFPTGGWTQNTRKGEPLYDPEADSAFYDAFMEVREEHIQVEFVDANLNDETFSSQAVSVLRGLIEKIPNSISEES